MATDSATAVRGRVVKARPAAGGPIITVKLRNSAPSPSANTSVSAVATSWRPRRPRSPIPRAEPKAKTPRPISVLIPIRVAAAAPANEPFGIAWATNAEPRSTTKKPTAPPTTATIVATIQALTMNPENIGLSVASLPGRRDHPGGDVGDQHQR